MIPDENLPEPLRQGLRALRDQHCPQAAIAAIDANFALVDLGDGEAPDGYIEREVRVFARVPLDILNVEPYGVVTVPLLHRSDGAGIPHQHASHTNARLITPPAGVATGFWSWDWKGMGRRTANDLALVYEWAWKCLRNGLR
jgi:hypothetical protein